MTAYERFCFNMKKDGNPDDWLSLVAGWKQEDGSISLKINASFAQGTTIKLYPKHEKSHPNLPDFEWLVQRKKTAITDDGEMEILA